MAAAGLLGLARAPSPPPAAPGRSRPVVLEGRLREWRPLPSGGTGGELDGLRAPDGRRLSPGHRRLRFSTSQGGALPPPGCRLLVQGLLVDARGGPHLERAGWQALAAGSAARPPILTLRQAVRRRLQQTLPPAEAGLASALILGERLGVQEETVEAYRRLGLLHILAVSGMHLWLWDALLRRFLPRPARCLRLPALVLATLLAGAGAPVTRALSAVLLRDLGARLGRRIPSSALWSAALFVEMALLPPREADVGLILSYCATAGLIAASRGRGRGAAGRVLLPSAAAFLASAPWLHALQGTVEPWTILFTPLLGPLFPVRLVLYCLAMATPAGRVCGALLHGIAWLEGAVLSAAERLPFSPMPLTHAPTLAVAALCALLLLEVAGQRWSRAPLRCIALALAAAALLVPAPRRPGLAVLAVGHGLATVACGSHASLLFDLGSADLAPRRLLDSVLMPELARRRWPVPARGGASHGDADHVNAMRLFAERHGLRLLEAPAGARLRVRELAPLEVDLWGCLAPAEGISNAGGQALEVRGAAWRAVVLGDQFGWSLRRLAETLDRDPLDVLVLPHHGLTTDGLPELLDALNPRQVWASCGPGDVPLPAAALLARRGIPLHTTLEGTLSIP